MPTIGLPYLWNVTLKLALVAPRIGPREFDCAALVVEARALEKQDDLVGRDAEHARLILLQLGYVEGLRGPLQFDVVEFVDFVEAKTPRGRCPPVSGPGMRGYRCPRRETGESSA